MDFSELLDVAVFAFAAYEAYKQFKKTKGKGRRRFWVRELYTDRSINGFFERSFHHLKQRDTEQFYIATRMMPATFDVLANLLNDRLTKTSIRTPISPECQLFLTLVYLSQGGSKQYLSMTFKMGLTTVRRIVYETCGDIWEELCNVNLSTPNTHEWKKIAEDFENIWNMPGCVGAIDGKHVNITCPPNLGSQFYNYKGTYSIVLLAVYDANYTFTAVDIGAYGSQSDGGVLNFSHLGQALLTGKLQLPNETQLRNSNLPFPHYFVGDAAFPLRPYLMRPYPGRLLSEEKENFNKRLSRARRTIENAFGILTAKWRILRNTLNMSAESAEKIVKAGVVLHNFCKMTDSTYCPPEYADRLERDVIIEGLWRQETRPLSKCKIVSSNNASRSAI